MMSWHHAGTAAKAQLHSCYMCRSCLSSGSRAAHQMVEYISMFHVIQSSWHSSHVFSCNLCSAAAQRGKCPTHSSGTHSAWQHVPSAPLLHSITVCCAAVADFQCLVWLECALQVMLNKHMRMQLLIAVQVLTVVVYTRHQEQQAFVT